MYQITQIKVSSTPPTLGTITDYYFLGRDGETSQWVDKPTAVAHVDKYPNTVYVAGGGTSAYVETVANGLHPYLRTKGDGTTSDNLLALPIA
jgi:hypothetical protein